MAIMRACSATALPLLAATVIAILTFMPIYYSPHITGELLSSMVVVIGVSLIFSWVFALTQTPFFIQEFVRRPRPDELTAEMFTASSVFVNGKLKVDYAGGCAYLDENELHLTPIEYKLLCLLSKNVGKVLTHTFITQNIWGRSWDSDVASLRVFMATLR